MGHRYADLDAVGAAAGICACTAARRRPDRGGRGRASLPALMEALRRDEHYANVFLTPGRLFKGSTRTRSWWWWNPRPDQVETRRCSRLRQTGWRSSTTIRGRPLYPEPTLSLYETTPPPPASWWRADQELTEPKTSCPRRRTRCSRHRADTKNLPCAPASGPLTPTAFRSGRGGTLRVKHLFKNGSRRPWPLLLNPPGQIYMGIAWPRPRSP
jgi:hypothetical protein